MSEEKIIENITYIGLTEEEAKIFIELRRINMDTGSVHLNYQFGKVKSMDEFKHKKLSVDNPVDNPIDNFCGSAKI